MFLLSEANMRFYSLVGTLTQLPWAVYLHNQFLSALLSSSPECLESQCPIISVLLFRDQLLSSALTQL